MKAEVALRKIRAIFILIFLGGASPVTPGTPQDPSANGQSDPDLIRISTQFVMLDALVVDKRTGQLVGNLEAKDFLLKEDAQPQTISYFSRDQLPLSIVLLFDLTETVQPILKPLARGAFEVLRHLKPQDVVSVMVFSSHTELLQGFTEDRGLAATAIEKASDMKTTEGTFIHEDMYEAIEQALRSSTAGSRRVLVWLTDGTANFENSFTKKVIGKQAPARLHTKQEATTRLLQSGVAVAALIDRSAKTDAFLAIADMDPLAFIGGGRIGDINRYADLTGGPVLRTSKKEVAERLSQLIDQLRGRYTLGYKPGNSKPEGSFCKLELTLRPTAMRDHAGLGKAKLSVRTKVGFYR